jgi:endo-1,4-beta-xylanase
MSRFCMSRAYLNPARFSSYDTSRLDQKAQPAVVAATTLPPLRVMADQLGVTIGTELDGSLFSNLTYQDIITREFNMATVDSGIYWKSSEPERGKFVLGWTDQNVAFAKARNLVIRGHPLVWVDNSNSWDSRPDWVANGHFTRDEWIGILRNHVTQIVSHYQGQMREWSVVNELDPRGILHTNIGPEYIEMAFEAARQTDPNAILIYNDFWNEYPLRFPYYYNNYQTMEVVERLKNKGLIDGVGLQMHVFNPQVLPSKDVLIEVMRGYGLPIYITELDVDISQITGTQQVRFAYQADIYRRITDACLESGVCKSMTVWGIGDKYSWVETYLGEPNADPTLFDDNLQPKPAYYAVQQSFYDHLPTSGTGRPSPAAMQSAQQTSQSLPSAKPSVRVANTGAIAWDCSPQDVKPCNTTLRAVEMVTPQNGWAVGDQGTILHWDGTAWSRVNSPTTNDLYGVSVVSSSNVWAVGDGLPSYIGMG